jgi:hypothetical protein
MGTTTPFPPMGKGVGVISGGALEEFDSKSAFGEFVLGRAGLTCLVGERQRWSVGGHELTVELRLDRARCIYVLWVHDGWPTRPVRRSPLCLAEVYAFAVTGTVRKLNKSEQGWFKAKAVLDAGLFVRPDVRLAALPADAPTAAVKTWGLIREVEEVRAAQGRDPAEGTPLVAPWLASLNGIPETAIRPGKVYLESIGHIEHIADGPGRFGRPLKLWSLLREPSK